MDSAARFVPPILPPPDKPLGMRAFLRVIRENALLMWPQAAYRDDAIVRPFLGRLNVLVNAPDAIRHVLMDNTANYRRSPASIRILRPIAGEGLLLSEGEAWKLQRRTIAPALAPRVMPMLARHIVTVTNETLDGLAAQAAQGPIDLLATMQFLSLEIAGRSMFSLEMQQHGPALRRLMGEYASRWSQAFLLDMLLPPSVPAPRDFGRARFRRRWMALIDGLIAERLAEPAPVADRDLFDLLRSARDPETGAGFSPGELRDQVATLLVAGHETTALVLFWALVLLAQAPAEAGWLAEEVRPVAVTPDGAMEALGRLRRTRAVVSETLRLYPPAFTLAREAIGPDRVGAIDLPRRSVVLIAPWVLHRHQALWREPAAFDPGRFMPDAPAPPRFAYLPFGVGPRVCVGAQFALTEAVLVLALLVRRFRVELADTRPVLPMAVVTTQPDYSPRVWLREW
jgi:cytochrome P450